MKIASSWEFGLTFASVFVLIAGLVKLIETAPALGVLTVLSVGWLIYQHFKYGG